MTNMKKRSAAVLTVAILTATLGVPAIAVEAPAIRVSSYKGSTLEVGERSGLIIGPSGTEYTVTSSDPDTVVIEQVLTFWVAAAKSEGTAEITASKAWCKILCKRNSTKTRRGAMERAQAEG